MIKVSQGCLGEEELVEVREAFAYGYFGHAYKVIEFEKAIGEFLGAKNVVAVNTGTSALHLSIEALRIGIGHEVIVPSLTFAASFQAISATGATPVPCEVYEDTLSINIEDAERRITSRTKAIMPIHYTGNPCNLDELYALKEKYGIRIIEDAAHAFGSYYKGKKIGSFGDIVCFSFDSIKNITCGEGGAIVCQDEDFADLLRKKRMLGTTRLPFSNNIKERTFYSVDYQGFRYHMSNINAAIGLAQIRKVDKFIKRRREICLKYDKAFKNVPNINILDINYETVAPHIYVVKIKNGLRNSLIEFLAANDIETGVNYVPNHLQPFYRKPDLSLPVTEKVFDELLVLPLHFKLTDEEVDMVIEKVIEFLNKNWVVPKDL